MSSDDRYVYFSQALTAVLPGPGVVAVFRRDDTEGALSLVQEIELDAASSLALSPDGSHLYASGVVFARDPVAGTLTMASVSPCGRAKKIQVSPDALNVYCLPKSTSELLVLDRDAATGAVEVRESLPLSDGPSDLAVTSDGERVYVTTQFADSVLVFRRDQATGRLMQEEALRNGVAGIEGLLEPRLIALSPDGSNIYVNASGKFDPDESVREGKAIVVLRRQPEGLRFVQVEREGIVDDTDQIEAISVAPDGRHVYALSPSANRVLEFRRLR